MKASMCGSMAVVTLLLKFNAQVDLCDKVSLLHFVVLHSDLPWNFTVH